MKAVLLAAGRGTRMRPLSDTRPKPMLPVGDKPLLAHTAEAAVDAGADELVIVDQSFSSVRRYFGDTYHGAPVSYAVQDEPDGTAGAVAAARDHLDGPFAVLNGDNLYDPDDLQALFEAGPAVGVHRVEDPSAYGVLETDGTRATGIVEKPANPKTDLANTGAYVFPASARQWLDVSKSERGEREVTDVLDGTIRNHDVQTVEIDRWLDCGRPWELLEANEWQVGEIDRDLRGEVHPDATIHGDVMVENGATVREGSVIEGPVLVRAGTTVGPNAYVRGTTLLGPDATVGHSVEIKNSVLMEGASVPHRSYVGDSVLGRDVNLGAGTTVANLRHDGEPIKMRVKGELVSTGRRKFGVVLGDEVKTGIQTSLNAGVSLPPGATTKPGEVVLSERDTEPVPTP